MAWHDLQVRTSGQKANACWMAKRLLNEGPRAAQGTIPNPSVRQNTYVSPLPEPRRYPDPSRSNQAYSEATRLKLGLVWAAPPVRSARLYCPPVEQNQISPCPPPCHLSPPSFSSSSPPCCLVLWPTSQGRELPIQGSVGRGAYIRCRDSKARRSSGLYRGAGCSS